MIEACPVASPTTPHSLGTRVVDGVRGRPEREPEREAASQGAEGKKWEGSVVEGG